LSLQDELASIEGLRAQGFEGFIRICDLTLQDIPPEPGIYAVVWDGDGLPPVAEMSVGGWFKKKNPSVSRAKAMSRLIPGVQLLYLGKAGLGSKANRGLRKRVGEYLRFGQGEPIGHWGGRLIWQIQDPSQLRIGWKIIDDADPEHVEKAHLLAFKEEFGQLPYANLRL
ncbi:hypothetical protein, partial [Arthrobacter sp.]|uniref:hypothetical protein n=1 Tax=Arthrobacter sp. TaxID=1667 RepID=UPI0026DFC10E